MLSPDEQARARLAQAGVAQRATLEIAAAHSPGQALAFVNVLHSNLDRIAADEAQVGPAPACREGCAHCCSLRVELTDPEALRIAAHLRSLPIDEYQAHVERLQARAASPADQRRPCAFLREQRCSIYALRPATCRTAHSLSVAACESQAAQLPQLLSLVLKADILMAGTRAGYLANGLPSATHELCQAVLAALSRPDAAQQWFEGVPLQG
jgi:uncharacterized protein